MDPLSNSTICLRDATLMQRLGVGGSEHVHGGIPAYVPKVNTIRVYNLDPDINHDDCASIFNAAGIYMLLDVNSPLPNESLNRGSPWESYNSDYMKRVFKVIDAFKGYPNTLGFFSGNEVINEDSVDTVPAYLRAVTRDCKDYIAKQASRAIPVGYSAADVRSELANTWAYLSCNIPSEPTSKIDLFGLNSYSWCGDSSFTTSSYNVLVSDFGNTTIPVFFSEYGCNKVSPRIWTEVPVLYGPQMTGVMSGGIVYEYTQEANNYGLVQFNNNNTASLLIDYTNLQSQYDKIDLKALQSANATATALQPPTCNPSLITGSFSNNFTVPARVNGIQSMIDNGLSGSQQGKLVAVGNTQITETVYDSNGNQITGLALNKLGDDESNLPGSNTSGSSSNGTSAANPGATKKGAAVKSVDIGIGKLITGVIAAAFLFRL